jgi:hypothetical protein
MVNNQLKMDSIRDNYGAFCGLCDPSLLEMLRERVEEITQEWQRIEERLKNKIVSLKVTICFSLQSLCYFPFHSIIPLSCNRLQKKKTQTKQINASSKRLWLLCVSVNTRMLKSPFLH